GRRWPPPLSLDSPRRPAPPERLADGRCCPSIPGYEVLGVLGRGGMGVVYQARHLRLGRVVALKMILSGSHASPDELVRFRKEAEMVARLRHPAIIGIYEIGEHGDLPYIALELMDGGRLAERIHATPHPPALSPSP